MRLARSIEAPEIGLDARRTASPNREQGRVSLLTSPLIGKTTADDRNRQPTGSRRGAMFLDDLDDQLLRLPQVPSHLLASRVGLVGGDGPIDRLVAFQNG
jgi:hypothetical protein